MLRAWCAAIGLMVALILARVVRAEDDPPAYLFTSFRGNGEDGLHLANSVDGYRWTALDDDRPFLAPRIGGRLMRDPCLVEGDGGVFHLVWTTGWHDRGFGYASSKDLRTWSEQQFIPVNEKTDGANNTWAPELFYDGARRRYLIFWATTIAGRFPKTDRDGDHNHRLYYIETADFVTFTEPKLLFDPGFNCIDGTIIEHDGRYVMVFKDERLDHKCLRTSTADDPRGPYGPQSEPISGDWVEGPSVLNLGSQWLIYFDHYTEPHYYGALETRDWKQFGDVSPRVSFPPGTRHGTALRISGELLRRLQKG